MKIRVRFGSVDIDRVMRQNKYANKKKVNPGFRNIHCETSDYEDLGLIVNPRLRVSSVKPQTTQHRIMLSWSL